MNEYIKKEDAEQELQHFCDDMLHHFEMNFFAERARVKDCIDIIRKVPSADVVEVRHGHWDEDMECSICGCLAPVSHVTGEEYAYDYCPNCGARMDGEEQERNIFLDESIDETAGYGEEQEHE